jgi:hypothetical protein
VRDASVAHSTCVCRGYASIVIRAATELAAKEAMSDPLPAELLEFLARHIDSIVQLEALLLLRSAADEVWDVPRIARRLYVDDQEASDALAHLAAHGFLAREPGGYRFCPLTQELLNVASLLADHYRRHLIPVTNLIHAKPRRIRQFADAFKLKKD